MTFTYESRNAAGQRCCAGNTPDFPRCQRCRNATLPTEEDFSPPSAYKKDLAALSMSAAKATAERTHPTEIHLDQRGVPEPYFHELQRLKENRR